MSEASCSLALEAAAADAEVADEDGDDGDGGSILLWKERVQQQRQALPAALTTRQTPANSY